MHTFQNNSRSNSNSKVFIKNRNFGNYGKNYKELINQANSVNIISIFKSFNVSLDEFNTKCLCPFPDHNERSPSFVFYKNTNRFYCFGCKEGGGPVEFVSHMNNIDKITSAENIISNFEIDPTLLLEKEAFGFQERQMLYMEFSEIIRSFIMKNLDDKTALEYAENAGKIFDTINSRNKLDNAGIKSILNKLKLRLEEFRA